MSTPDEIMGPFSASKEQTPDDIMGPFGDKKNTETQPGFFSRAYNDIKNVASNWYEGAKTGWNEANKENQVLSDMYVKNGDGSFAIDENGYAVIKPEYTQNDVNYQKGLRDKAVQQWNNDTVRPTTETAAMIASVPSMAKGALGMAGKYIPRLASAAESIPSFPVIAGVTGTAAAPYVVGDLAEAGAKGYDENGVGGALANITYEPFKEFVTDPNLGEKFHDRPVSTAAEGAMTAWQGVLPAIGVRAGYKKAKHWYGKASEFVAGLSADDIMGHFGKSESDVNNGMSVSDNATAQAQPGTVDAYIQEASQQYGVPEKLIRSVVDAESSFNPEAGSEAGAYGYMQLMPETAEALGVNRYDPRENILGGTKYLRQQLDAFGGDVEKALAAYNAGPGAVKEYNGVPPYAETQNYVQKIMSSLNDEDKVIARASEQGEVRSSETMPEEAYRDDYTPDNDASAAKDGTLDNWGNWEDEVKGNDSILKQAHEAAMRNDYPTASRLAEKAGSGEWANAYRLLQDEGGSVEFAKKPESPLIAENINRGNAAMEHVIANQSDAIDAMYRPDLGGVSFYWGVPGEGPRFKKGQGIAHIIAKRTAEGADGEAVARKMVDVIARGRLVKMQEAPLGSRALIEHDGHTAVLSLYKEGNRQTWLLTGWENTKEAPNAKGKVYDSPNATASESTRFQPEGVETSINDNIQQNNKIFNGDKEFMAAQAKEELTSSGGGPILDEVSRKQIMDAVKDMFTTVRTGRLGTSQALGWYNKITGMIRSGKHADFPTIMHEVGHYLDNRYGLRRAASAFDSEFLPYIKQRFGNQYDNLSRNEMRGEGIAEFIRQYTIDRPMAQKNFPQYYKHFESFLQNAPDAKRAVNKISNMLNTWYRQAPEARGKGAISFGDDRNILQKANDALHNPKDTAKSVVEKGKELFDAGYDKLVDQLAPLDRMMKKIEQITGQKLPDTMDVFKRAWLTRGWAGKAQTLIEHGIPKKGIPALQSIVKSIEGDMKGFSAYVTALREVDAYNLEAKGAGKFDHAISNLDAAQTVAKYRQNPVFVKAQKDLVKFNNYLLDMLVDAGIKDKGSVDNMKARWANYVPFFREFSDAAIEKFFSTKGFGNISNPIKAFKGSTKDIINPLESIIKNTYQFVNLAERNKVGRLFVDLAQKPGLGNLIERVSGSANSKDSTFAVWNHGVKEVYATEPALYRAIMLLDREPAAGIAKILQMPAGWLRAGATLTPEFMARNPIRDAWDAFIYSKYGFIPGVDTFRGLMHFLKKDDMYWEYMNSGAAHSALVSLDRDYLAQNLREIMGKTKLQKLVSPLNPKTYLNILRAFSEATEVATRLGEYENARKGYTGVLNRLFNEKRTPQTAEQAALGSRDITLDFSRSGVYGKEANKYIAFWNAAVQGTDKMVREFKQNPVRTSSKVFLAVTLPSIVLYYMNRNDPRYQELPQWQKDLFWIIPTKDTLIRIPKPFELGILFGTSVERMLQWVDKKDSNAFKGLGKTAFESMMPGWMPTALLPIVEWYSNYSFFMDRNIVSQSQLKLPPVMQYGPNTSSLGKWIGSAINRSPSKVDNTIRDLTGGLGGLAMTATDVVSGAFNNKPSLRFSEYPGIRAFTATPYKSSQSVQDFYDAMNTQEQLYNQYRQTGQRPAEFNPGQYQRLQAVGQIMTQLNKQERSILNSQTMSSEEKRNRLDRLQMMKVNYARIGLGRQKVTQ
jgi:hypothetical protein